MNLQRFQPSNGKCNIRMFFILPYKEIITLAKTLVIKGVGDGATSEARALPLFHK